MTRSGPPLSVEFSTLFFTRVPQYESREDCRGATSDPQPSIVEGGGVLVQGRWRGSLRSVHGTAAINGQP